MKNLVQQVQQLVRGRLLIVALVSLLALLVPASLWQMQARSACEETFQELTRIQRSVNSGLRSRITVEELQELCGSSKTVGPINGRLLHIWRAPFANYCIRFHLEEQQYVVMFDRKSGLEKTTDRPMNTGPTPEEIAHRQELERKLQATDETVANAVLLEPEEPTPDGIEKVVSLLQQGLDDSLSDLAPTLLQADYVARRTQWLKELWIGSYEQYAAKGRDWDELAHRYLTLAVEHYGRHGFAQNPTEELQSLRRQLETAGCDDPLIYGMIVRFRPQMQIRPELMHHSFGKGVQLFMDEPRYPARVAYLASYPLIHAADLLKLQILEAENSGEPKHDVFATRDPIEMRILYEYLTGSYELHERRFNQLSGLPEVLATQEGTPEWLQYMLLAATTTDANQISNCLFNAWHREPKNPESSYKLLKLLLDIRFSIGANPSFAKEDGSFWFAQAVRGQFDYEPAYTVYLRWLHSYYSGNAEQLTRFAENCVNSGRFDTGIPLKYLAILNQIQSIARSGRTMPRRIHAQLVFGRESAYRYLLKLAEGYADDVKLHNMLQNYVICAAHLSGHSSEALQKVNAMEGNLDPGVFDSCRVTMREIRAGAERKEPSGLSLNRHVGLWRMQFFAEGKALMVAPENSPPNFFRIPARERILPESTPGIQAISLTPDEKHFVSLEPDGEIILRNLASMKIQNRLVQPSDFAQAVFTRGEQDFFCTTSQNAEDSATLDLRSFEDGTVVNQIETPYSDVVDLSMATTDSRVAMNGWVTLEDSGRRTVFVEVYDFEANEKLLSLQPFQRFFERILISADGKYLVVAGADRDVYHDVFGISYPKHGIKVFNVRTQEEMRKFEHPGTVNAMLAIPKEGFLVTGCDDGYVRIWNLREDKLNARLCGHGRRVVGLAYSPLTSMLASASDDGRILFWRIQPDIEEVVIQSQLSQTALSIVDRLYVDPANSDIITNSRVEGALRWHSEDGYQSYESIAGGRLQWLSDGRICNIDIQADKDAGENQVVVSIRELKSGDKLGEIKDAVTSGWTSATLTSDGRSALTIGDIPTLWNLETGLPWKWGLLTGHEGPVVSASLSGDDRFLVTLAREPHTQIHLWKLPDVFEDDQAAPSLLQKLTPSFSAGSVVLSPDSKSLLLQEGASFVHVYDVASGEQLGVLKGQAASYSADGQKILLDGNAFNIQVYNANTLELQNELPVFGGGPRFLQWGPSVDSIYYEVNGFIHGIDMVTGQSIID